MQLFAEKSERLKQAKREAEKEIAAYRQQREEAYKKQISDVRQRSRGLMSSAMPKGVYSAGFYNIEGLTVEALSGAGWCEGPQLSHTCDSEDSCSWLPGQGG